MAGTVRITGGWEPATHATGHGGSDPNSEQGHTPFSPAGINRDTTDGRRRRDARHDHLAQQWSSRPDPSTGPRRGLTGYNAGMADIEWRSRRFERGPALFRRSRHRRRPHRPDANTTGGLQVRRQGIRDADAESRRDDRRVTGTFMAPGRGRSAHVSGRICSVASR